MIAVQPDGCAPIVRAAAGHRLDPTTPTTAVSGLQVGDPPDGDLALKALAASSGWGTAVSDADVYAAQRRLARDEAILAEPAGATALAGLLKDADAGRVRRGDVIVCLVTGSGFKDPSQFAAASPVPVIGVEELDRLGDIAHSEAAQGKVAHGGS
jgi:threonine synthase